jgi:pyruvate kinase
MKTKKKLELIQIQLEKILRKAENLETEYASSLSAVHPVYRESALNLLHYLAFRSFDIGELQQRLRYLGLPDLANIEGHVITSLQTIQTIIHKLLDNHEALSQKTGISIKRSEKLLRKNTKWLFGNKSNRRRTRIMVTMPSEAAENYQLVNQLMQNGMNSARINCAHDDEPAWAAMIENVQRASKNVKRKCKLMMDLGGPKLRTGPMQPGPQVVHIKPQRDSLGTVVQPARVWVAPPDVPPPGNDADAVIPVSNSFIEKIRRENDLLFTDSRGKSCRIEIIRKQGKGRWGLCSDSAYITTGTELVLHKVKETGKEKNYVGELLPSEQFINLHIGDTLLLHSAPLAGEPVRYDSQGNLVNPAHISCTLPEIFQFVKTGEPVFLNDGKIEGVVEKVRRDEMEITITYASASGSKLKADKGINFPGTDMVLCGLTDKDRDDLPFVARNADVVNLSFVNQASDVKVLQQELEKYEASPGIVLKIETRNGFKNLPEILLQAMQTYPVGIMVARGDLAIETGWENFATIQEEIMRLGESAHIPVIWATQVLESLAKKGVPTRSEITDAALSQRAECVMLNKGPYIEKALKTLNEILVKMQNHQKKRQTMLPRLKNSDGLSLSYAETETLTVEI